MNIPISECLLKLTLYQPANIGVALILVPFPCSKLIYSLQDPCLEGVSKCSGGISFF